MMTVAEWRKRAHDCMTASRLASDRNGQSGWQALSDAWVLVADWRDREQRGHKELSVSDNAMPIASPNTAVASPIGTSVVENAERLRARLALGMSS